ncbi:MAG: dihydrofolate reductase [Flavobacteriaceae bacterium]|nr:dihydrofolate reductase [Flavobacteriaceae bacterium]
MSELILIAAAAENNALGINNDLPWHLPDDFKRFKALTTGHKIIMGRKTLESFPRALPKREHIAITREKGYRPKFECTMVHSLKAALALAENDDKAYIIGGGEIYRLALPFATKIELTRVHAQFEADTFFPEIDLADWELVHEEYHPKDGAHAHDFTYLTYVRK